MNGYWLSGYGWHTDGRIGCDFSKNLRLSGGSGLNVHTLRPVEEFFGAPRKHVEKCRYILLAYICKQQNTHCFLFVLSGRSLFIFYCIQCFQVQVYIADTKCTEDLVFLAYSLIDTVLRKIKCTLYTVLKDLHLASLRQKMYVT